MDSNEMITFSNDYDIVFFDGVCNLCNHTVGFLHRHDPADKFRFLALQETLAQSTIQVFIGQKPIPDSVILLSKSKIYTCSQAALQIARRLSGGFFVLYWCFIWIPAPILDPLYRFVARNRYSWFGKQNECAIPSGSLRNKFLKPNK